MRSRLTCAQGHQWEIVAGHAHGHTPQHARCPVCGGAAADAVNDGDASATTVSPGDVVYVQLDNAPTPPLQPTLPGRPGPDTQYRRHPLPDAAAKLPIIAGYDLLGELGRGGMGVVYKARHLKLNRLVALKMILAGGHAREDDLVRFRCEAEAVAGLYHPNIVQIFDIGEQDGLPYFSLEFVAGGTLEDRTDGTPWQATDAARLTEILAAPRTRPTSAASSIAISSRATSS